MAEMFVDRGGQRPLNLPDAGSVSLEARSLNWQSSGTEGFWIKSLFEDERSAQRTWLMKVEPGAWSPPHSRTELKQIYVLEGTFYDQEREYVAGDYIIRAAGTEHTAGSRSGAIVMLIYSGTASSRGRVTEG